MKYIGKTLHFLNRNFFYLMIFCLVPAALIVADFDVSALVGLLTGLWAGENGFTSTEIFSTMTLLFKPSFWFALFVLAVLLFSVCLCFSYTDRRMRIGIVSIAKPFLKVNEVLVAIVSVGCILLAFYELTAFLLSKLLVLFFGLDSLALQAILIPLLLILFYGLLFLLFSLAVNWIPLMLIPGYRFSEAFGVSIRMAQGHIFGLMIGLAFPFLVTVPVMILAKNYLNFMMLDYLICVVGCVIQISYAVSYCMVVYFDMTGRERADLKSYRFY